VSRRSHRPERRARRSQAQTGEAERTERMHDNVNAGSAEGTAACEARKRSAVGAGRTTEEIHLGDAGQREDSQLQRTIVYGMVKRGDGRGRSRAWRNWDGSLNGRPFPRGEALRLQRPRSEGRRRGSSGLRGRHPSRAAMLRCWALALLECV
jgi:hypothetical protein